MSARSALGALFRRAFSSSTAASDAAATTAASAISFAPNAKRVRIGTVLALAVGSFFTFHIGVKCRHLHDTMLLHPVLDRDLRAIVAASPALLETLGVTNATDSASLVADRVQVLSNDPFCNVALVRVRSPQTGATAVMRIVLHSQDNHDAVASTGAAYRAALDEFKSSAHEDAETVRKQKPARPAMKVPHLPPFRPLYNDSLNKPLPRDAVLVAPAPGDWRIIDAVVIRNDDASARDVPQAGFDMLPRLTPEPIPAATAARYAPHLTLVESVSGAALPMQPYQVRARSDIFVSVSSSLFFH
jgi:hypothetical protein